MPAKTRDEIEVEIRRVITESKDAPLFRRKVLAGRLQALVWAMTGREISDFYVDDPRSLYAVLGWPFPEEAAPGMPTDSDE